MAPVSSEEGGTIIEAPKAKVKPCLIDARAADVVAVVIAVRPTGCISGVCRLSARVHAVVVMEDR